MKRKLVALCLCLAMPAALAACGGEANSGSSSAGQTQEAENTEGESNVSADSAEYEEIDLNNTKVWGDVGPDGSTPKGLEDVMLTDEEKEQVRAGNYKVAICYHQLDNQVNQSKLQAALDVFEDLNIEVVCTTDAQSDANKEVNDLESALALEPDLLLSMPYDVDITKATCDHLDMP